MKNGLKYGKNNIEIKINSVADIKTGIQFNWKFIVAIATAFSIINYVLLLCINSFINTISQLNEFKWK